jgi:hypothetical protein
MSNSLWSRLVWTVKEAPEAEVELCISAAATHCQLEQLPGNMAADAHRQAGRLGASLSALVDRMPGAAQMSYANTDGK